MCNNMLVGGICFVILTANTTILCEKINDFFGYLIEFKYIILIIVVDCFTVST